MAACRWSAWTVSRTSWTRTQAAPARAAARAAAMEPPSRSDAFRAVLSTALRKLLRLGADQHREAQGGDLVQVPEQAECMGRRLAEAEPGIEPDAVRRHALDHHGGGAA